MTPKLSKELILEIISWLPPREAMQLCCMSKEWRCALSSSQFRSLHLDNFTRKSRATSTFFWRHRVGAAMIDAFFIVRNDDPTYLLSCLKQCSDPFAVVGIINGVVCLAEDISGNSKIVFWNPVVRRKISLLRSPNPPTQPKIYARSLGLAYDVQRNEYELFRASNLNGMSARGHPLLQVFSLRTGVWTNLPHTERFTYCIANSFPALFFNGFCNWPAWGKTELDVRAKPYILHVRAGDHFYSIVDFPRGYRLSKLICTRVVTIEGFLALLPVDNSSMIVWTLREYGAYISWIKRFHIVGEVSTFADDALLFISGIILQPRPPTPQIKSVKVLHAGYFLDAYSESLELLSEGEPCTCFCHL